MTTNELEIVTNGQYKNIDLGQMQDGDSIVVTKKFDVSKKTKKNEGTDNEWTMIQDIVEYNGEDVGFFMCKGYKSDGTYVSNVKYAETYDELGGVGDKIKITMKKGMTSRTNKKTQKAEDIVFKEYSMELVE